jgi:hypothetical protein
MAVGVTRARKIQFGKESAAGTPVPATMIWRGKGLLHDGRVLKEVDEQLGYLPPTDGRIYVPHLGGRLDLDPIEATYEELPYLLTMGLAPLFTGVQDGAGTDYLYQYDGATTAQLVPTPYTVEAGDNIQAYEMEYCFCSDFKISGAAMEAWMMSGTLLGRQLTKASFTGALVPQAVREMLFQHSKLYIDASGGSIGSTQITGSFKGFEIGGPTGFKEYYTGEGAKTFTGVKQGKPDWRGILTMEHDANGVAQIDAAKAGTPKLIRVVPGSRRSRTRRRTASSACRSG